MSIATDQARHASTPPGRPRRRRLLIGLLVLVLAATGGGLFLYRQLNGNLTRANLFSGTTGSAGKEQADPFGRVPINLLVIGTDSRASSANCKLGGDCGRGSSQAADVEMVVHIAADRSNITVVSVPRDIVTDLPGCRDSVTGRSVGERFGQINAALTYGPGCSVAAVHTLTGIPIDHFIMIDFSGVIAMSDSVGGVSVCVSDNVYDSYSHLRLSKGTHTLKGLAALEFVRSRHAFGDGSDLGRTYAQHVFLSAMVRTIKSAGTLLNPARVLSLAQAATRALTVDEGIGSISRLVGLASELNKVGSGRITFATAQTVPDPQNAARVVLAPAALDLFASIIRDESLSDPEPSTPSASPSATSKPSSSPQPSASTTPSSRRKALANAHAQTATKNSCVQVSHQLTVSVNGVPMTPVQAFAATPTIPLSAP